MWDSGKYNIVKLFYSPNCQQNIIEFTANEIHYISFRIDDIDSLMEAVEATASITDVIIEDNRRRHVTLLLSERYFQKEIGK